MEWECYNKELLVGDKFSFYCIFVIVYKFCLCVGDIFEIMF